jgi:hypothetical protein
MRLAARDLLGSGVTFAVAASTLAVTAITAQASSFGWNQLSPATSPGVRYGAGMAYDSARGVSVLFGGAGPSQSETWEFNGSTWTLRAPAISPAARREFAMAYDGARHVTVLFGGIDSAGTYRNDTWEWDGTSWTPMTPSSSPSGRMDTAMVYDSARQVMVLFGGLDPTSGVGLSDTWEWDGSTWTQRATSPTPPGRYTQMMAYDTGRLRTVMFSGLASNFNGNAVYLGDTWEYDGNNWTQPTPANSPQPRTAGAMAYDQSLHAAVLFGGGVATSTLQVNDTWTWDGSSWAQQNPTVAPTCREWPSMVYDGNLGHEVLFGGYVNCTSSFSGYNNETWSGGLIAPALTATGASPVHANEGIQFAAPVAAFSGGVAPYMAAITWGDGSAIDSWSIPQNSSGNYTVTGTHTYAEEGVYTVSIVISDKYDAIVQVTTPAQIPDSALTAAGTSFAAVKKKPFTATVATFTDADPSGTPADYSATIAWGDGTTTLCPSYPQCSIAAGSGSVAVQGTHTYRTSGAFTVQTTIKDAGGATTSVSTTALIRN